MEWLSGPLIEWMIESPTIFRRRVPTKRVTQMRV